MKVSRVVSHSFTDSMFGRIARLNGWRGGHVTYFADDSRHTGVGSTAEEAVRDLRAQRSLRCPH